MIIILIDIQKGPYSTFRVGCAVLVSPDATTASTAANENENGKYEKDAEAIITGANVENASYPVGQCAETCTVGKAVVSFFIFYFINFPFPGIGERKGGGSYRVSDTDGYAEGMPFKTIRAISF